jgi:hypothetical protein
MCSYVQKKKERKRDGGNMRVMRIDWTKVRVKMAEQNIRSVSKLAAGAGVHQNTLYNEGPFVSNTVDRIADFLGCDPREFITVDEIETGAPPDRHGARVGERTKAPSTSSGAERTAPAPSAPVAEPAEAPITAASLRKPLALQLPGIGQEGEPDRAKFAALEERRRMLLAQAGQIKGG